MADSDSNQDSIKEGKIKGKIIDSWNKFYDFSIRKPWAVLIMIAVLHVLVLALVAPVFELIPPSANDFTVRSDPLVARQYAYVAGADAIVDETIVYDLRNQKKQLWTVIVIFEGLNGQNLLTRDNIKKIYAVEKKILESSDYKKFCFSTTSNGTCAPQAVDSIVSTLASADDDAAFSQDLDDLASLLNTTNIGSFFGKRFSATNLKSSALRTFLTFGGPINKQFQNTPDNQKETNEFKLWASDMIDLVDEESNDEITYHLAGVIIAQTHFDRAIDGDFLFAAGSFIFVLVYITLHTRSFFLSSTGLLGVLLSFPVAYFVYRRIFQITFFNNMHILMIFVMLGIGADNIFVFTDAWNQAPAELSEDEANDYSIRMAWTWKRAAKAMFVTSFTTAAAFLATATSSIMPISTFGVFAAMCVFINYLIVITYYPMIVLIWQKWLRPLCPCGKNKVTDTDKDTEATATEPNKQTKHNAVERFFEGPWTTFVLKGRYPIVIVFFIWFGVSSYYTSQMSPLSKSEEFLVADHPSNLAEDALTLFPASANDAKLNVDIVWGIKGINDEGTNLYDPLDTGVVVWDSSFEPWDPAVQQYLSDLCVEIDENPLVLKGETYCVMGLFKAFRGTAFPVNISNTNSSSNVTQRQAFTNAVLAFQTSQGYEVSKGFGIDQSGVRYITVSIPTDFALGQPRSITYPYYEKWEAEMQKFNKKAPPNAANGFQTSFFSWAWMATEAALTSNAFSGMAISLSISFIVLVLSTGNFVVGTLASFCIVGIVASVIACMHLQGWELGVAESISMVILVGFSVDYVVHLANSYVESDKTDDKSQTRLYRVSISLREMGVSVVGGAATTFGSSLFLWGAQSLFFRKFAVLLELTVSFSALWALIFFPAASLIVGPEGTFGSVYRCKSSSKTTSTTPNKTANVNPSIA